MFHPTEMDPDRMKRSLALLVVFGALAAMPGIASAASTCSPGQTPGTPPLYCVPPAPPVTPAAAAHDSASDAANYLSTLTPATLAAKGGAKLPAAASGKGTITIVLTAKIHGRIVVIGSGRATVGGASGEDFVKLILTKAGKAALKSHKGKLQVTVTATFKPKSGKPKSAKSRAMLT
jgi:hypothetical protein